MDAMLGQDPQSEVTIVIPFYILAADNPPDVGYGSI
jgi:hypothetical protein